MDIQTSTQKLYKKFQEKNIKQDFEIATLQPQINNFKTKLSSRSISKLNTQKISKRIYSSKNNSPDDRQMAEILRVTSKIINR